MNKVFAFLIFIGVLGIFQPAAAETVGQRVIRTGVLRCGYMMWPPYYQKDAKTGELSGLAKDVVDEMMATIGIKVEYVQEVVMGQQPQDLAQGKYDAVCWDAPLMPQAAKYVDYTKPWFYMPVYAYAAANLPYKTEAALNDPAVTFSGFDGDLSQELVTRKFPRANLQSIPSTSDPSLIALNVATGKSQANINDPISNDKFLANNPGQVVQISTKPLAVYGESFSVKQGERDLIDLLNKATDVYINSGNNDATMNKYDPTGKYFIRVERPAFAK